MSDTWARIDKYAVRNRRRRPSRKSRRAIKEQRAVNHAMDRQRQAAEFDLNWTLIRHVLDNEPSLTLEQAKRRAKRIQSWD